MKQQVFTKRELGGFLSEFDGGCSMPKRVWSIWSFESHGRFYAVAESEDGRDGVERRVCEALSEETALARLRDRIGGRYEHL